MIGNQACECLVFVYIHTPRSLPNGLISFFFLQTGEKNVYLRELNKRVLKYAALLHCRDMNILNKQW